MKPMRGFRRPSVSTKTNRKVGTVLIGLGLLLAAPSLWGHHGLSLFDTTHTVRMQGTVRDFQWINPHAEIQADMIDENGKYVNWKLELGSLAMLTRAGWNPKTVKRGDNITVQGFRAKDSSPYMHVGRVELPNGKSMEGFP
jgi:hypothetical protein